jgi:hypothetical protein
MNIAGYWLTIPQSNEKTEHNTAQKNCSKKMKRKKTIIKTEKTKN